LISASFGNDWSCPTLFPDFNQCNFFLWGFLKDTIYRNSSHTIQELKQEISAALMSINEHNLVRVL
jgi:hypothetical protein